MQKGKKITYGRWLLAFYSPGSWESWRLVPLFLSLPLAGVKRSGYP